MRRRVLVRRVGGHGALEHPVQGGDQLRLGRRRGRQRRLGEDPRSQLGLRLGDQIDGDTATRRIGVEQVAGESTQLVEAIDEALVTLDGVVASTDALVARIAELTASQQAAAADAAGEPGRPFDITEYTTALEAAQQTVAEMNALVDRLDETTEPGVLNERLAVVAAEGGAFADQIAAAATRVVLIAAAGFAASGVLIVLAAKLIPGRRPRATAA